MVMYLQNNLSSLSFWKNNAIVYEKNSAINHENYIYTSRARCAGNPNFNTRGIAHLKKTRKYIHAKNIYIHSMLYKLVNVQGHYTSLNILKRVSIQIGKCHLSFIDI